MFKIIVMYSLSKCACRLRLILKNDAVPSIHLEPGQQHEIPSPRKRQPAAEAPMPLRKRRAVVRDQLFSGYVIEAELLNTVLQKTDFSQSACFINCMSKLLLS